MKPLPSEKAATAGWDLDAIVADLRRSREVLHNIRHKGSVRELPSRRALGEIVEHLSAALFPTHFGATDLTDESIDYFVGASLGQALSALAEQIRRGLRFGPAQVEAEAGLEAKAAEITRAFAHQLPEIRAILVSDLQAAYEGDPAATSFAEILLSYPGVVAVLHYRLAHALHRLGAAFLARLISKIAHSQTGIDIHPAAEIGSGFFIDHGTGVVIGETAIVGNHVRLYHSVTLGAKRFAVDETGALIKGKPRHPIVEDDVVIYAGATVLGRITIGRGAVIGGNAWVTQDVAPGSVLLKGASD